MKGRTFLEERLIYTEAVRQEKAQDAQIEIHSGEHEEQIVGLRMRDWKGN